MCVYYGSCGYWLLSWQWVSPVDQMLYDLLKMSFITYHFHTRFGKIEFWFEK